MFELPDDDENFWEDLPLEDITNSKDQLDRNESIANGVKRLSSESVQSVSKRLRGESLKSPESKIQFRQATANNSTILESDGLEKTTTENERLTVEIGLNRETFKSNFRYSSTLRSLNTDDKAVSQQTVKTQHTNREKISSPSYSATHAHKTLRGINSDLSQNKGSVQQEDNSGLLRLESPDLGLAEERVPAISQHVINHRQSVQQDSHVQRERRRVHDDSPRQTPVRTRRKFPGPAGLLPKISPGSIKENTPLTTPLIQTSPELNHQETEPVLCSSQSEDVFNESPWQTLLSDLGNEGKQLLSNFSIATSLQKARKKLLPKGKVPLVMAVIESVDWQGSDAGICLKDKSGKIKGTVHQTLMKDYQCDLHPGSVVVLRQVSMISPTTRNHYLNVTPSNIVAIYSNTSNGLRTIRNIEKSRSLSSFLQNTEPYLTEEIKVRRRSGIDSPCTPALGQRNDITGQISRSCANSSIMRTPQGQQTSSSTPQRPPSSNKFQFVKTPNIVNSSLNKTPSVSSAIRQGSGNTNSHQNQTTPRNYPVANTPVSQQRSMDDSYTTPKQTFSRNLCSSNFNTNAPTTGGYNQSHNTIGNNNSMQQHQRPGQLAPKTCNTAIDSAQLLTSTGHQKSDQSKSLVQNKSVTGLQTPSNMNMTNTGSTLKNGFKFRSSRTNSPNISTGRIGGEQNASPNCNNLLKSIKEPPRPCLEAESLWQDDLSDDLLSKLSDEML